MGVITAMVGGRSEALALPPPARNNGGMLQAIKAPVVGSIVLAGLALGGAAVYGQLSPEPVTKRLVLHAVDQPNAIYLTAFRDKQLTMTFDDGELRPLRFEVRAQIFDGCRWLGVETLTPIDDKTFSYDYSETVLECLEGAVPALKTPRTGLVTVED